MVADEEGERDGEGEDSGAEEVRAAEQVGAVRGQGLHGWALLGPRRVVGAVLCFPSASSSPDDAEGMGSPKGSDE